jgi:hypothetical protein
MSTRLSKTIASLHEARSIDLQHAKIDAEGACALADALQANTSVTNIRLEDNQIGVVGASALASALRVNTSVTKMNLYNNRV